jgi:hypothetical protein
LTDAELQSITNEARARIVRLYADSYKRFFKGFQILQKIQANSQIIQLQAQQELGMKGQETTGEKPSDKKATEIEGVKWENMTLRDARVAREIISQQLSRKDGKIALKYNELSDKLLKKGDTDRGQTQFCISLLNIMNTKVRGPILSQDNFDADDIQRLEYQLSQLNQMYETTINAKPKPNEQANERQPFLQVV